MNAKQIKARIGTLDDMGQRFVAAWKNAEKGGRDDETHVTFLSLDSFVSVMSPKRVELLRALRRVGPSSVRALAGQVGRDYKSVHSDVALLAGAGLIERGEDGKIRVPWDKVTAEMELAS